MTQPIPETPTRKAEVAEETVHSLNPKVARFVFEEGVRHTQALQIAAHALDARATQVATILFAAAALAAGSIGTKLSWAGFLAATSTVLFIWGGLICFRSIESTDFRAPGTPPEWWRAAINHNFTERDALAWAAKEQQIVVDHICAENADRSDALNSGLRLGVAGSIAITVSAVIKFGLISALYSLATNYKI